MIIWTVQRSLAEASCGAAIASSLHAVSMYSVVQLIARRVNALCALRIYQRGG